MADQLKGMDWARSEIGKLVKQFSALSNVRKGLWLGGGLLTLGLLAALVLSGSKKEYRVLFSQIPDKDGGQIVSSLQQADIPYSLQDGGVISVPADQVYDARMKLAAQGLPKASGMGFELMDHQRFGISQFAEQVNYQRAVEGELARSVESLAAVESARVHLAIPRHTVFVRDQQDPSASVVVNLHPGRILSGGQIAGIIHLVSSSVPNMLASSVTVVDQDGNLISAQADLENGMGVSQKQLAHIRALEQDYVRRIESILEPMFGQGNIRAQVTMNVDFSEYEETSERFRPNTDGLPGAVRSQQVLEDNSPAQAEALGVPGALSNQPPSVAEAPVVLPGGSQDVPGRTVFADQRSANDPSVRNRGQNNTNRHKESLTNYELDRTIQHTRRNNGAIRRLTAAVLVNNKLVADEETGALTSESLTDEELMRVRRLVQEAIGYDPERGDSVNVVNTPFASDLIKNQPKAPFDRFAEQLDGRLGRWLKYLFLGLLGVYLWFSVLRPLARRYILAPHRSRGVDVAEGTGGLADLQEGPPREPTAKEIAAMLMQAERSGVGSGKLNPGQIVNLSVGDRSNDVATLSNAAGMRLARSSANLELVKELMKSDPRTAAQIIREWINYDE